MTMVKALGGMVNFHQFFVWRMTWNAQKGKYEKVPQRWDGRVTAGGADDPHMSAKNPMNWRDAQTAILTATQFNARNDGFKYTPGFFLTKQTGYWFLDVDKCIDRSTGQYNAVGQWLYAALPGCFFELSSSGNGYHLIGRGAVPDGHGSRCDGLNLEFYTHDRGIAFSPDGVAWGSADTNDNGVLWHHVMPQYFPPRPTATLLAGGGTGPRDDWRGPVDDEELIRRAMQSQSTGAMFGNKASFADLWTRNMAILSVAFTDGDGTFAESEADMALAAHLAFWTGCDVDRMERLMWQSAMARPKWREHATYLRQLTIMRQVALQTTVCQDKPPEPPPGSVTTADGSAVAAVAKAVTGNTFMDTASQMELFAGCCYVNDARAIFVPQAASFELMGSAQFDAWYGGYSFVMDKENAKISKSAWECFTQSQMLRFPKVHTTMFRPDLGVAAISDLNGVTFVNTYVPSRVPCREGDVSPFLNHLAKLLPVQSDREIILAYMAAMVQHKGVKFKWCPVLQGVPGNGKSTIAQVLEQAIGDQHTHIPKSDDLNDKFNDWLYEKILIVVNDVYSPDGKENFVESIKPMITDERLQIQGKGVKKMMRRVCANFIMSMNRRDGIRKDQNDRRFAIFYTEQQSRADLIRDGMNADYFNGLYSWLKREGYAALTHYLAHYPIPERLDPTRGQLVAPDTSSIAEVLEQSMGAVEESLQEAIDGGATGFRGGFVSWKYFSMLCDDSSRGKIKIGRREEILENFGFIPHPGLRGKGWTNNGIALCGGSQDRLFVRRDHPTLLATPLPSNAEITKIFTDAQMAGKFAAAAADVPAPPVNYGQ